MASDNPIKKAVFLYDFTGLMAQPWLDAGYECWLFDGQHPPGITREGLLVKVGMWFSAERKLDHAVQIKRMVGNAYFLFGFPECTDLTNAGTRSQNEKRQKNPLFQIEAIELADLVRIAGILLECPYGWENPVGAMNTQYRRPDFTFNPCDYGGYLPEDDQHPIYPEIYPDRDAYNKQTCIWHSRDFKQPKKRRVEPEYKENPGWKKCGGKSLRTKNIRSATPRGFSQAVFEANSKRISNNVI